MLVRYSGWLLICTWLLAACQDPAPRYSMQCYVRFDAPRGEVLAEATVKQYSQESNLPGQPMEMPGGLLYQGSAMQVMPVKGLTYRRGYKADFVPEHAFSWQDAQGGWQKVTFPMRPITNFTFGQETLLRTRPDTLQWEGEPLMKGEALVLMWENQASRQTVPMEIIRSGGDASLEFPATKLAELSPGRWTLYLVRKRLAKVETPGMVAEAILEYYSKSDTLEVK